MEGKTDNCDEVAVASMCVEEQDDAAKLDRVMNAPIGTVVAFKAENGSVKSAKIVRRSSNESMLKLTTKYGASHIVKYSDIVWVKTGTRWPRWVYNKLKGYDEDGEKCEDEFEEAADEAWQVK